MFVVVEVDMHDMPFGRLRAFGPYETLAEAERRRTLRHFDNWTGGAYRLPQTYVAEVEEMSE